MHAPGVSPRILDTLRQLGLTEYGARCYVALLALQESEAAAVAEAAEVPRTKVYATLKDLADQGWVVALGGRPVRYRAAPPDERIAAAEKRMAEEAQTAMRELQARYAMGAQMVPFTAYLLRGRPAIEERTADLVRRAREELFVNLGFALPGEERALATALRAARDRGVRIRLLLGPQVDARAFGDLAKGARRAVFPFRGVACDWRQALIVLPGAGEEPVGLWNPTLAFMELVSPMLRATSENAPPLE
ncbi:MAG TPA: helix-turn-helix domain-containing protein [Candidatus Thermoplasmatota archaeon]|nr:helix-turn-helix domain-containing protein [Candidatus Thermoplasmatota archaeon]